MTPKLETYEVFRYKVVYPGGTYVRISPATEAEKTGDVLEFGTTFDASKSLFLDGINYAKLSDGSGWVFERKDDVQILELLQIIRVPLKKFLEKSALKEGRFHHKNLDGERVATDQTTPNCLDPSIIGDRCVVETTNSSDLIQSENSITPQPIKSCRQHAKVENRLWRDIRARCAVCSTFDAFLQLVIAQKINIDGSHAMHEQRVLNSINIISSITGQCSVQAIKEKDCTKGVDIATCLWVLVHMGSRVPHTMNLIVESANTIFERSSTLKKAHLLRVVLEVGSRTKIHAADLARQVDILPDDIRNFLQRWVIIQSYEEAEEKSQEIPSAHVTQGSSQNTDNSSPCEDLLVFEGGQGQGEGPGHGYLVSCTPVGESRHGRPHTAGGNNTVWPASLSDTLFSWCGGSERSVVPSRTLFSRDGDPKGKGVHHDYAVSDPERHTPVLKSVSSMLWEFVSNQLEKISDTDMQTACLV